MTPALFQMWTTLLKYELSKRNRILNNFGNIPCKLTKLWNGWRCSDLFLSLCGYLKIEPDQFFQSLMVVSSPIASVELLKKLAVDPKWRWDRENDADRGETGKIQTWQSTQVSPCCCFSLYHSVTPNQFWDRSQESWGNSKCAQYCGQIWKKIASH